MSIITKFVDKHINKAYTKTREDFGLKLPLYIKFGKYKISAYAMNVDWESLRIKIEKDNKIIKVIKNEIF